MLIGVDRLDYIKGMPHKLLAFELFLARNPSWVGKVTLIQVGVPTRTDVAEYQVLTQCLFLKFSELQVRVDGVGATSRHRDAVDAAARESTWLRVTVSIKRRYGSARLGDRHFEVL